MMPRFKPGDIVKHRNLYYLILGTHTVTDFYILYDVYKFEFCKITILAYFVNEEDKSRLIPISELFKD